MICRKKICLLFVTVFLLTLVYASTFVFDTRRREEKRSRYSWISRELLEQADWIEIDGMSGPVILERVNNIWVMPLFLGEESPYPFLNFPVRQSRVADLFGTLSRRAHYPLRSAPDRSSEGSGFERLGLEEGQASRIIIRGGAGRPLLDLLIGFGGAAGSTVYLRKAGLSKNDFIEVRSGEDIFSVFTETGRKSWFDLSLFGGGQSLPAVSHDMVQQIVVYPPEQNGSYMLSRNNRDWVLSSVSVQGADSQSSGFPVPVDRVKAESWLRSVLNAEAEDFDYFLAGRRSVFNRGSIILELGDGSSRILHAGMEDENKNRPATVGGFGTSAPEFVYILTEWTLDRLFPDESFFTETPLNGGL